MVLICRPGQESPTTPFIAAVGSGPAFAYHKFKTMGQIGVLPVSGTGSGACVCASHPAPFGQGKGTFSYVPTSQKGEAGKPVTLGFGNSCAPAPRGDLLWQKNPTCDVRWCVEFSVWQFFFFFFLTFEFRVLFFLCSISSLVRSLPHDGALKRKPAAYRSVDVHAPKQQRR